MRASTSLTSIHQRTAHNPSYVQARAGSRSSVRMSVFNKDGLLGGLFGGKNGDASGSSGGNSPAAPPVKQMSVDTFMMSAPVGMKPEFPPFTSLKKGPDYDLRFYELYPIVEMKYEKREEGYGALGSYIDGYNSTTQQFAYTQPVVMQYKPSGCKYMSMTIGSPRGESIKFQDRPSVTEMLQTLPQPTDDRVALSVGGGELVAILRFEGFITPQTTEAALKKLKAALKRDGVKLAEEEEQGLFRVGQYGAVYSVEDRMNELMLKVKA